METVLRHSNQILSGSITILLLIVLGAMAWAWSELKR
jgi:hypothetical protein